TLLSAADGRTGPRPQYQARGRPVSSKPALEGQSANTQADGDPMTKHVTAGDLVMDRPARDTQKPAVLTTRIGRTYRFESAHHLPHLPEGHKCKNLHGHNYRMEVVVRGTLDVR